MHFAAAYGHLRLIVLLNQFDPALVGVVDRRGQTPLHVACQADPPQPDIVSLLLRIGADIAAEDEDQQTALSVTPNDSQQIRGVLLQHDEEITLKDEAPVVMQTLEDLHAEFDDADEAFGKLLSTMHFGDEKVGDENETSSSSEDEHEDEDESSEGEEQRAGGGGGSGSSD
eukprot:SAG22_NODE_2887_length_2125_cov_1.171273_1_plen_170_part_10